MTVPAVTVTSCERLATLQSRERFLIVGPHSPTTDTKNALRRTDLDITVANPGLRGEACASPPPGGNDKSLDGDASPTRGEALERLGIDLGRVGVMTTARTNSRQSFAAPTEESPRTGRVRQEGKASNNFDGLQKEENRGRKRNRGGAFATTSRGSESGAAAAAAAKNNQEQLTEKLRELNALLASEPLSPPADANCVTSKLEHNNNRGRTMPKYLLPAGGIERETGGFSASVNSIHDYAVMDSSLRGDVSPQRINQVPARSTLRDDLPRIRAQGVGTKEDVAAINGQEPHRACSDVERAPEERVQTEAPVIPKLNIDGRGSSIETLSPREDKALKLDAKGLPNHRQECFTPGVLHSIGIRAEHGVQAYGDTSCMVFGSIMGPDCYLYVLICPR